MDNWLTSLDDFLLSDDDSDDLVPLKVRGNAKPHPKAVVSPQPISQLSEEPSSGEDDEDLKGGPFTILEVEKIKAEYAAFDKRIAGLAREMGRSVNSIQKIGGRVSRVVNPCRTTAWNVFQSSYPTNPDKSVSQSDYTKNTVRPAYDELVKKYGGERSEDWAAESTRMVKEYTETREAITGDIAKHGGEVAKIIASHKRAWQKDFRVLASFGVHCKLTVLADNACSPAAHAQNGQLFGTVEMELYYKSRRDFKSHVGDVYTFILSAKAGVREAEEHKARTLRHEREEAFKNPNKAKGKVLKMLIQLFEPFIRWTTFPWQKLPQRLLSHNLRIDGVLPLSRFRLLGSLSIDHYNVSEIQAMYNALENGQLKVSECTHEESNSGETALITDSGGQVLMMVASALEMIGAKKKLDSQRAAERRFGNGPPVRNPSHTVMVNLDRIATQGLGKRPRKGGDDINQPRKMKCLQVKSAEFIDDLDETPTAGPSHLHMQATSSHHNDVQQHSALSIDSGATVGVPLQHTTGVPVVPTFNPHDPFSMMDDVPIPNGDDMSFPLLDPLLFQGPSLKHLLAGLIVDLNDAHSKQIWEGLALLGAPIWGIRIRNLKPPIELLPWGSTKESDVWKEAYELERPSVCLVPKPSWLTKQVQHHFEEKLRDLTNCQLSHLPVLHWVIERGHPKQAESPGPFHRMHLAHLKQIKKFSNESYYEAILKWLQLSPNISLHMAFHKLQEAMGKATIPNVNLPASRQFPFIPSILHGNFSVLESSAQ
ncbi:hypothetical protein BS47DRAFT_1398084 [Hydnum rufescens UP504]|uniref:Uncharacterized protein n=1 Tax=Hydnum rufescens UP504 TaxID=1448309 RepID=A0A9P6DNN2_9AGAM|nr:hypothetical protein BS47DRAFT_1398084 [Hydnum rufescens UP504]